MASPSDRGLHYCRDCPPQRYACCRRGGGDLFRRGRLDGGLRLRLRHHRRRVQQREPRIAKYHGVYCAGYAGRRVIGGSDVLILGKTQSDGLAGGKIRGAHRRGVPTADEVTDAAGCEYPKRPAALQCSVTPHSDAPRSPLTPLYVLSNEA